MKTMTRLQSDCLAYINHLFATEMQSLAKLYQPSGIMAHIQIESDWNVGVDSTDGFGSIGLMQVLPSTAIQMGVHGPMNDPENSILAGMRYLQFCMRALTDYRRHSSSLLAWSVQDVVAAYNMGPGNVERGRKDPDYVRKWMAAQKRWVWVDSCPITPYVLGTLSRYQPAPVAPTVPEPVARAEAQPNRAPADTDPAEDLNAAELAMLQAGAPDDHEPTPDGGEPDGGHESDTDADAQALDAQELAQAREV